MSGTVRSRAPTTAAARGARAARDAEQRGSWHARADRRRRGSAVVVIRNTQLARSSIGTASASLTAGAAMKMNVNGAQTGSTVAARRGARTGRRRKARRERAVHDEAGRGRQQRDDDALVQHAAAQRDGGEPADRQRTGRRRVRARASVTGKIGARSGRTEDDAIEASIEHDVTGGRTAAATSGAARPDASAPRAASPSSQRSRPTNQAGGAQRSHQAPCANAAARPGQPQQQRQRQHQRAHQRASGEAEPPGARAAPTAPGRRATRPPPAPRSDWPPGSRRKAAVKAANARRLTTMISSISGSSAAWAPTTNRPRRAAAPAAWRRRSPRRGSGSAISMRKSVSSGTARGRPARPPPRPSTSAPR